ncbi:hypothetical protein Taro_037613 [Colocasia esculenta]|uniref:Uncharacterized protein n=1 Tax=Colocasia esculenta TaxID=4460 RepID=A0A843W111_COLES|nr:hypothetical protein [Colocasia esculenta]
MADNTKDGCRLQQIKDEIHSIFSKLGFVHCTRERFKLREELAARRQKKLIVRRNRQKYLEEAALREMELIQELDRERTNEAEREIERQRLLEVERAKTRELRYNLDMERERQIQRDLQRELEQVESGVRTSRRDFSSNPNNRPRERYRERENGRMGGEGSLRPSSRGQDGATSQTSTSTNLGASVPSLVLTGSRTFSGQPPTILQPRERPDERGMVYEDNYEGSRDSGDASSVGDPDVVSSLDTGGGFASGPRQGRGSKSRQIVERRERDGRREGKWERKHS